VAQSIDTVLNVYQNYLSQGIEVVRQYEAQVRVWGSEDALTQVWTNLLINSIQAMQAKGRIVITLQQTGTQFRIGIADNGPGILPAILDKIFKPLFTTKPKGEGTGMGLHICKQIIEEHRGSLVVFSEPGHTEFVIHLPANAPEPATL
jgi:signal transduction histidine kinase